MKQIFINLKRLDVAKSLGGVCQYVSLIRIQVSYLWSEGLKGGYSQGDENSMQ